MSNSLTVEIKGRSYPIKFNQYALEQYARLLDFEGEIITAIYATAWAGLKGGAYVQMKELDLTFEEVVDWVDEEMQGDSKTIIAISDLWTSNFFYKKWLATAKEIIEKKRI